MSVVDRAMDVMAEQWEAYDREDPSMDVEWDREMANRLAAARLLVTDEMQYVVDMVALFADGMTDKRSLIAAHQRYLAAQST